MKVCELIFQVSQLLIHRLLLPVVAVWVTASGARSASTRLYDEKWRLDPQTAGALRPSELGIENLRYR